MVVIYTEKFLTLRSLNIHQIREQWSHKEKQHHKLEIEIEKKEFRKEFFQSEKKKKNKIN